MNYKKVSRTVRKIATKTFAELADEIIIQKGESYQVYKDYYITPSGKLWTVQSEHVGDLLFSSTKVALAWCILDKAHQFETAIRLVILDTKIMHKQTDIDVALTRLSKKQVSTEMRPVLQCRVAEDLDRKSRYREQLDKCLQMAKYIKLKEFHK